MVPASEAVPVGVPMDIEEWRPIAGYEGRYSVSSYGRIQSETFRITDTIGRTRQFVGKLLKLSSNRQGYLCAGLSKHSRVYSRPVHRLVLETFIGPCPFDMQTCHNDGNQLNNRLDNLCWDTRKANAQDKLLHGTHAIGTNNSRALFTEDQVREIRALALNGTTHQALASQFNVHRSTISDMIRRKRWTHVQ